MNDTMTTAQLKARALEIFQLYQKLDQKRGVEWDASAVMSGLVGDIGDLQKLIMAKSGFRDVSNLDAKLRHEIADCLWSLLVLSHQLSIDIEAAFVDTMRHLEAKLEVLNDLPGINTQI